MVFVLLRKLNKIQPNTNAEQAKTETALRGSFPARRLTRTRSAFFEETIIVAVQNTSSFVRILSTFTASNNIFPYSVFFICNAAAARSSHAISQSSFDKTAAIYTSGLNQ